MIASTPLATHVGPQPTTKPFDQRAVSTNNTSMTPKALRRGGGAMAMADTKHAVAAKGGVRHHGRVSQGRCFSLGWRSFFAFLSARREKRKKINNNLPFLIRIS